MKCEMLLKAYFPLVSWVVTFLTLHGNVTEHELSQHG